MAGTATNKQSDRPSMSNDEHRRFVQFSNDNIFFQASSIKAKFRDRSSVVYEDDEFVHYNSTVIGDSLSFQVDETDSRQVRLYFIPPTLDWHKNQSYAWKLNQAWMSDSDYGWVFWNVNGYVDSELRVLESDMMFQCDRVEFTLWHNAPHGRFSGYDGKLVMENVSMAAFITTDNENYSSLTLVNPCVGRGACRAVNGKVTCGEGSNWKYQVGILSIIVALLVIAFAKRASDAGNYSRIGQEEQASRNGDSCSSTDNAGTVEDGEAS